MFLIQREDRFNKWNSSDWWRLAQRRAVTGSFHQLLFRVLIMTKRKRGTMLQNSVLKAKNKLCTTKRVSTSLDTYAVRGLLGVWPQIGVKHFQDNEKHSKRLTFILVHIISFLSPLSLFWRCFVFVFEKQQHAAPDCVQRPGQANSRESGSSEKWSSSSDRHFQSGSGCSDTKQFQSDKAERLRKACFR